MLDIREEPGGTAAVTWRLPAVRLPGAEPVPVLPASCRPISAPTADTEGATVATRWRVDCGPDGLVGRALGVDGLGPARTDALVRVALAGGRLLRGVVRAHAPRLVIPPAPRRLDVIADYGRLGVAHILSGPDHLVFLFGLVLLVPGKRRLVATATAFTAGHSVTLAAAALGVLWVPPALAELLIALTVLTLAAELARAAPGATLMRRWPGAVAGGFGLLHGLGFAGALRAVGLPDGDVPLALAAFNLGVEAGQVLFIAAALVVWAALPRHRLRWLGWVPAYGIGTLAALWCCERAAILFG